MAQPLATSAPSGRFAHDHRWLVAEPDERFEAMSPYRLAALLGKRVIHPGGRFSTRRVLSAARLESGLRVLEVGCGVATTSLRMARRHGVHVTAIDIDPAMLERARYAVQRSGVADLVDVRQADVTSLPFADASFDRVVVESVNMFVDRDRALAEIMRCVRPGGRVVDHEFCWARPPSARSERVFGELFAGGWCVTPDQWDELYREVGLVDRSTDTGPVLNFTPPGMLIDEGPFAFLALLGRLGRRWRRVKAMARFMVGINSLIPSIRYVITAGERRTT